MSLISGYGRASALGLALAAMMTAACGIGATHGGTSTMPHGLLRLGASAGARAHGGGSRPPTSAAAPDACPTQMRPGWVARENQRPGTTAWTDARRTRAGTVNGFLDRVSAVCGDTLTAYLTSPQPVQSATLTAYRMGWYGNAGGREVWHAVHVAITHQAALIPASPALLLEARWQPTLTITVTPDWTPGYYLLVVRAPGQTASSMPLVVRDDADTAPLAYQASVLTYQAYNTYGGLSAYSQFGTGHASRVLSFDRPYEDGGYYSPYQYELPMIREIEKVGLDTDYTTDVDVSSSPAQLLVHKGVITGGHSEYWTRGMYDAAQAALDQGVNLGFFGANAIYTAARLEPSPRTGRDRRFAVYRSTRTDPVASTDPAQATVNWADPPLDRPETGLLGQGYGYLGASEGLRILHPESWIFAGTGVRAGQVLPDTVGGEYDQVDPERAATPADVDVLAAMPMRFKNGRAGMATVTYYVAGSGAGVFDAGTTYWPCVLAVDCLHLPGSPASSAIVARMTDTVLRAFAAGPAGLAHPSTPHLPPSAEGLVESAANPADVAVRKF